MRLKSKRVQTIHQRVLWRKKKISWRSKQLQKRIVGNFGAQYMKGLNLEVNRTHTHNLMMFGQFFHHSSHGRHSVMAFEVLGRNLLTLIKRFNYEGVPLPIVREIAKQVLMGLDYFHRIWGIIHADLKPENVFFVIEETANHELSISEIFNRAYVDLYDSSELIMLSKRQAMNSKKKTKKKEEGPERQRRRRKENKGDDNNEEEEKETVVSEAEKAEAAYNRKSNAAQLKKELR